MSISGGFTASNNFAASSSPSRITELGVGSDEINRLLLRAALCRTAASHCTLLNNKFIDVSFSAEYRAHQGRLALFFKNQSSSIITGLKVTVDSVKDDYITFKQIDPPASIDPSVEVKAQYAVECLRPIPIDDVWPNLSIDFVVGGIQYAYALCMPVSIVSFCEPLPSDKATYMGRWKAIEGEGTEAQQVFSSSTAIDANLMKHVKTVIFPGMGVGAAEGLDNERTATGSASFRTGTVGADGKTVAIGVLMRLEGDPTQNKFRITVRSKHPSVAQGIKKFIVEQLS